MGLKRIAGLILLCGCMMCIFWLNCCYMFCSDDCYYALGRLADSPAFNRRLGCFITAWHENWAAGYRPIVHLLVRLFTGVYDKMVFNVANTVVWGALVLLILRVARGAWRSAFPDVVLSTGLTFLILCKGESYLWCAGSINYLWVGVATLLFLIMREHVERSEVRIAWSVVILMSVGALFVGWMQEAFSLPILCACGALCLLHIRKLTIRQSVFYLSYLVGAILLVMGASGRMNGSPVLSLQSLAKNLIMIAVAVKAVWLLVLVIVLRHDRVQLVQRNGLEMLIIAASVCMILIVGFNGERSLWAANLAAIVVLVREYALGKRAAAVGCLLLFFVFGVAMFLGTQIKDSFETFVSMYRKSVDGVSVHERIACGVFGRFFYQQVYTWQPGPHPLAFARFHAKDVQPVALSREMYDDLCLNDRLCVSSNRIPIAGDFYTTDSLNAIVHPLREDEMWMTNATVRVSYRPAGCFLSEVKREWYQRHPPPVDNPAHPVVLRTTHGSYLLCSKLSHCDESIESVAIIPREAE